jgi:hypothetical protein
MAKSSDLHTFFAHTNPGSQKLARPDPFHTSDSLPSCLITMNLPGVNQPVNLAMEPSLASDEEEGMSDEHSMTETSAKGSVASATSNDSVIAQDETSAVNRSKIVVYLVLLVTAAAVGTATYFFVSKEEHDDFETEVRYVLHDRMYCELCLYSLLTFCPTVRLYRSLKVLPRISLTR